jgi:hypothetical protein
MKVKYLKPEHVGKRLTVTGVAFSESEAQGHNDDTTRLMNQQGELVEINSMNARVAWDDASLRLYLSMEDTVRILD